MSQEKHMIIFILFVYYSSAAIVSTISSKIIPDIATSYSGSFNTNATQFFIHGVGTNTILRYIYNENTLRWEKSASPILTTGMIPTSVSWQEGTEILAAVNTTFIRSFPAPFLIGTDSMFPSVGSGITPSLVATSKKLIAICRGTAAWVYTQSPLSGKKYTLSRTCKEVVATGSYVLFSSDPSDGSDGGSSNNYVNLLYNCNANQCDQQEVSIDTSNTPTSIAVTDKYIFYGAAGANENDGKVKIYVKDGNNWDYDVELDTSNEDRFGELMDATENGVLLAIYASDSEKIYVYYKPTALDWKLHKEISLSLGNNDVVKKINIMQNPDGYLVLLSVQSNLKSSAGAFVINVTCSVNTYGMECSTTCPCTSGGVCNNSMWSNGNCESCNATRYGLNCEKPCTCTKNGLCSNHPVTGTGKCLQCVPKYFGPNCDSLCTCNHGICYDNIQGNGTCSSCIGNYYGTNCNLTCNCINGTCSSGVFGTGHCLSCAKFYYGPDCGLACPSNCSSCSDGISGNGDCYECGAQQWGPNCTECACKRGECSNLDGSCLNCDTNQYFGTNCENDCNCGNGICDSGPTGTGNCTCDKNYYGPQCDKLSNCNPTNGEPNDGALGDDKCKYCNNSISYGSYCNQTCSTCKECDSGVAGTGQCLSCEPNFFGLNCDQPCTCTPNGFCDSGPTGKGSCLYCNADYFGLNCEDYCTCGNGTCNYNVQTKTSSGCICNDGYLLDLSNNVLCHRCEIVAICTYGSSIIQGTTLNVALTEIGNLLINTSSLSFSSTTVSDLNVLSSKVTILKGSLFFISGDLDSKSSEIDLIQSTLIIDGDIDLSNSILKFNENSNITVNGCVYFNNITLEIDLNNTKTDNITLISFEDKNCTTLNHINFISYSGTQEDCTKTTVTPSVYKTSIVVSLLRDSSNCEEHDNTDDIFPVWAIITLATVLGFILLVILIVGLITYNEKLRLVFMPFRDVIPDYQHQKL